MLKKWTNLLKYHLCKMRNLKLLFQSIYAINVNNGKSAEEILWLNHKTDRIYGQKFIIRGYILCKIKQE